MDNYIYIYIYMIYIEIQVCLYIIQVRAHIWMISVFLFVDAFNADPQYLPAIQEWTTALTWLDVGAHGSNFVSADNITTCLNYNATEETRNVYVFASPLAINTISQIVQCCIGAWDCCSPSSSLGVLFVNRHPI